MTKMTWRTLTIEADGSVNPMPSKMHGLTGDGITWFVENNTSDEIKVKIKDFKKKGPNTPLAAVTFLVDKCTVPAGDLPGMIVAQITHLPSGPSGTLVLTKYTIDVKVGTDPKVDHDPDLEIEKP